MTDTPPADGELADRIVAAVGHGLRYTEADPESVLPEIVNAVLSVVHPGLDRLRAGSTGPCPIADATCEIDPGSTLEEHLFTQHDEEELAAALVRMALATDRLRAERNEFADRVDTLTAVAKSNKQAVQAMYEEQQKAQAERDGARAQVEQLQAEVRAQGDALLRQREQHATARAAGMRESAAMLRRFCPNHGDKSLAIAFPACHCGAATEIERDARAAVPSATN